MFNSKGRSGRLQKHSRMLKDLPFQHHEYQHWLCRKTVRWTASLNSYIGPVATGASGKWSPWWLSHFEGEDDGDRNLILCDPACSFHMGSVNRVTYLSGIMGN